MTAPFLWIGIPILASPLALILRRERAVTIFGGLTTAILALVALFIPIDVAMLIGPLSLKISPSVQILGRSLSLDQADGSLLAILYGLAALWFFGAEAAGAARRLVPFGLGILGLLVASIAVQPFLFAAPMIQIAALLTVPLLVQPSRAPGRGIVRFLIYQTLAMPFILFAGWLLTGVEASPGDLELAVQSAAMLGLGFAFLLAVFPLYNWIPMLLEEASPYAVGFLLWCFPAITSFFLLGFLDRYTFLRTSPAFLTALQTGGLLMVVTGGIWAAFQRHIGRMMGYAAVAETGFFLVAASLNTSAGLQTIFLQLVPRGLGMAVWALALTVVQPQVEGFGFSEVRGLARRNPLAVAALILAHLSVVGFPLLAGFPVRLALWEGLARQSIGQAAWMLVGLLGLLTGAVRTLAVAVMADEQSAWEWNAAWVQVFMLGVGILALFGLGLFPQVIQPFLVNLPAMFEHLGR
ncbi:MAG: proton-conducting transporter membrane subunit [Chloroflexota bacterium]